MKISDLNKAIHTKQEEMVLQILDEATDSFFIANYNYNLPNGGKYISFKKYLEYINADDGDWAPIGHPSDGSLRELINSLNMKPHKETQWLRRIWMDWYNTYSGN